MIQVKKNLLKGYNRTYKIEARNEGGTSDEYNYAQITIPTTFDENQQYTFFFKFKQFNGRGNFTVAIFDKINKTALVRKIYKVSDKQMFINFNYKKGVTDHILIYTDVAGKTRGIGAEVWDLIIVEGYFEDTGEEIVYLPHKEDVKPTNQAIFPIGGGYREVFPL